MVPQEKKDVCSYKQGEDEEKKLKENGEQGEAERPEGERTALPYKSSSVLPPVMLLCFVYHEKIPLMLQPHQTAD